VTTTGSSGKACTFDSHALPPTFFAESLTSEFQYRILFLGFVVALSGPGGQAVPQVDTTSSQQLLNRDVAFARATSERDLERWMSFLSDSVAISFENPTAAIGGEESVRKHFAPLFATQGFEMEWKSGRSYVSPFGSIGYTTGVYELGFPNLACKCTNSQKGTCVVVWQHSTDGTEWEVRAVIFSSEGGIGCGCGS
jgi:ketosteroid isomerase-like protein